MEKLSFATRAREGMLNVTEALREAVRSRSWTDGVLTVFCPHTTCGVLRLQGGNSH